MKLGTLYKIEINEYPDPQKRCDILKDPPYNVPKGMCSLDTLGKSPFSVNEFTNGFGTSTVTQILHTPFLDGFPQNYIPEITSVVEDINGNCYYPGSGPGNQGRNVSCMEPGCCNGPYCCNGIGHNNPFGGTYSATCAESLKSNSSATNQTIPPPQNLPSEPETVPGVLPDLIIKQIAISPVSVGFLVINSSTEPISNPFHVKVYQESEFKCSLFVNGMAGYEEKSGNCFSNFTEGKIKVIIDEDKAIVESDKSNNEQIFDYLKVDYESCQDTDDGSSPFQKGERTDGSGNIALDMCINDNKAVIEYNCPRNENGKRCALGMCSASRVKQNGVAMK